MKLCLVTVTTAHHSPGGMQQNLETLAEGLTALGHCVVVITSRHYKGLRDITANGVAYHFVEGTTPESYGHGFFEGVYGKFCELDRTVQFDGVYSESLAAAAFCGRIPQPLVFRLHAIQQGWYNSESSYPPAVWQALTWPERLFEAARLPKALGRELRDSSLTRRVYQTASRIVLDSEFSRRLLLRHMPGLPEEQLRVIPLSVDCATFTPLDKAAAKRRLGLHGTVLLFLSRITLLKGAWVALRAMERLGLPDVQLLIVGVGRDHTRFAQEVARRHAPGVTFLNMNPGDDRPLYYAAADLFLYPELTDPAFGIVGAEALACGTPVIGSDAGAIPEVMGECGWLFPRGNIEALCARIREALSDPVRLQDLGQRGRLRAQALFSHTNMVADLARVFKELHGVTR